MSSEPTADELEAAGQAADTGELGHRLAEMVDAEATRAEAGPDPDEDEPPAEPPDEPAEPSALELAAMTYAEAVLAELGEDGVTLCAHCSGRGYNPVELEADPHAELCPSCGGRGSTRTGSLVPEQAVRLCVDCQGRGWIERTTAWQPLTETAAEAEPKVPIQWLDENTVRPGALPAG